MVNNNNNSNIFSLYFIQSSYSKINSILQNLFRYSPSFQKLKYDEAMFNKSIYICTF